MIANSILCHGNSRFLQKVYMTDVDVTGTTSFASVSAGTITATTSLVSSGTLSVTGATTLAGATTLSSTLTVAGTATFSKATDASGTANNGPALVVGGPVTGVHMEIDADDILAKATGTTTAPLYLNREGGAVYLSNGTNISANNGTLTAKNLVASTKGTFAAAEVTGDLIVNGVLSANEIEKNIIRAVGGSIYISPTFEATSNTTIICTGATATTVSFTISDSTAITGLTYGGANWNNGSKIKFTGAITANNITTNPPEINFSSAEGTLTSNMNASGKLTFTVNYTNGSTYFKNASTNLTYSELSVMMYEIKSGSNYYPIGIYIKSYGSNKNSYIDIYGGTTTQPNTRLGLLNGLKDPENVANDLTINGSTVTGWGLMTSYGYFKGKVVSESGKIGGWDIGTNILKNGDLGVDGSVWLLTADRANADAKAIGGSSSALTTWRITAGDSFGVTKNGDLYCNQAHISGEITATSGTIGGCSITGGVLKIAEANITGTLSSNVIDASSLTIGQSQVTNLTTDLGSKASTSSVTTLSNKVSAVYGTSSTAATTQEKAVTCSNFEYFAGALITVKFSTANTYATAKITMNVNSKGAKDVWVANAVTSSTNQLLWGANAVITFRYDGTQFVVVGEPRNWYGASTTAAATAAKTDTTAATGCVVCKGTVVSLSMTNNNTATSPTLNINGTGAKNLYAGNGTTRPLASNGLSWTAGSTASFIFDGQYWRVGETAGLASAYAANTAATNAAKTASNYISTITGGGIKVSYTTNPTSYTQITADGTSIYQNSSQVASFGSTAIIGPSSGEHVYIDSDSVDIMNGSTVLASFGANSVVNNILATSGSIGGFNLSTTKMELFDGSNLIGLSTTGTDRIYVGDASMVEIAYEGDPPSDEQILEDYRTEIMSEVHRNGFYVTNMGVVGAAGGSVFGNTDAGHVTINDNEFDMSYGNESILKFSYGLGINESGGTSIAPYYTIGKRSSNNTVGNYSCAIGYLTAASNYGSFAEGTRSFASGISSHAEGNSTKAQGNSSHAEGSGSKASGMGSHAEGLATVASGNYSHSEGETTYALGNQSHTQGFNTVATESYQTVIGKNNSANVSLDDGVYTFTNVGDYAFIIGNGTANTTAARSNALTVDWDGNLNLAGGVTVCGGNTTLIDGSYSVNATITFSKDPHLFRLFTFQVSGQAMNGYASWVSNTEIRGMMTWVTSTPNEFFTIFAINNITTTNGTTTGKLSTLNHYNKNSNSLDTSVKFTKLIGII